MSRLLETFILYAFLTAFAIYGAYGPTTGVHTATSQQIRVRACSIVCDEHPEWGTWGVMEDRGDWFEILGRSGSRVLFKSEADKFWSLVNAT